MWMRRCLASDERYGAKKMTLCCMNVLPTASLGLTFAHLVHRAAVSGVVFRTKESRITVSFEDEIPDTLVCARLSLYPPPLDSPMARRLSAAPCPQMDCAVNMYQLANDVSYRRITKAISTLQDGRCGASPRTMFTPKADQKILCNFAATKACGRGRLRTLCLEQPGRVSTARVRCSTS
jgi:hypothetical protein